MTFQQGKDNKQKSLQCLHKHKICRQLSIIPENTFIENEIMNESQKSSETSFVFDISTMDDYCLEATALGNLLDIEASNLIYVNCMVYPLRRINCSQLSHLTTERAWGTSYWIAQNLVGSL